MLLTGLLTMTTTHKSLQRDIKIHTVEPSAMESLINFAYTGKIVISTANVQNLMMGASFLQLTRVRDACADFLQLRITAQERKLINWRQKSI